MGLIIANILLSVCTFLLFVAARSQSKSSKRMKEIVEFQHQTHLFAFYNTLMRGGYVRDNEEGERIRKNAENLRQQLITTRSPVKPSSPPFLKAPLRLYVFLKWLCTGKWDESIDAT